MDSRPDILASTCAEFEVSARSAGIPGATARAAYRAFHRLGQSAPGWARGMEVAPGKILADTATKFTLPVGEGLETESVVIPMPHRGGRFSRTLCLSSQVGCAMGCTFCETAQMGLLRSLGVREIVQQFHAARFQVEVDGERPCAIGNIVFMGMGEPMENLDSVLHAVRVLCDGNGCGMASSAIAISTVGRTAGIARLGEFIQQHGFRRVGLAVSLNAPNDEIRSRIMPVNRAEPMAALRQAMLDFPRRRSAAICVEYVLIPGVNDRPEHADEVCAYLRGIRCSLNLIPYNPRRDSPWPAPTEESVREFVARCVSNGQFTKRRMTKGRSAMAACGQLGNAAIRRRRFVDASVTPGASPDSPGCA